MEVKNPRKTPDDLDTQEDYSSRLPIIRRRRLPPGVAESAIACVAAVGLFGAIVFATSGGQQASEPQMAAAVGGGLSGLGSGSSASSGLGGSVCDVDSADGNKLSCLFAQREKSCAPIQGELCDADLEIARIAWKYFENNYNPETGLVNSVNNYPVTTMWDTGSALAAYVAARDFGFIEKKEFDDAMVALLETLATMELFNGEAPNKVYHTQTKLMVDYNNNPAPDGIGVSILDLARLVAWTNQLQCRHPKYYNQVNSVLSRWDYTRMIDNGQMYGMARDADNPEQIDILQEGRLGYEQYAGKIFEEFGFNQDVSAYYENEFRTSTEIMGIDIVHDVRDPSELGANNYVVTESYAMDAMELGLDEQNTPLLTNIFELSKKRWKETGIVTAISEDNIDRAPWFLYNTIFNAGQAFNTTTDTGVQYDELKSVSTKAALSMALLFPEDEYSQALIAAVESAYDPEAGWYSGVYENGAGYNTAITANTNGVIMTGILHKKYGSLLDYCKECERTLDIKSDLIVKETERREKKKKSIAKLTTAKEEEIECLPCKLEEQLAEGDLE